MIKYFLITSVLSLSLLFSYEVGQTMSTTHQNMTFDVCNSENPQTGSTSDFKFADLNGDLNGGNYYVFHVDMAASW